MTKTMYDAAYPPATPPVTDAVLIYAGGDTPHVWTDAEIAAQSARYRLPCFVRSDPAQANAATDAGTFAAWLEAHDVPHGVTVVLDLETAVDPAYVTAFAAALENVGNWQTLNYGSRDTIFENPVCAGYFTAHHGATSIDTDPGVVATQYGYFGTYDLSWIADSVALWDLAIPAPAPAPAPPPMPTAPVPTTAPTGGDVQLPSISQGSTLGYWVKSAQSLLRDKMGQNIAVDGNFGPVTSQAVKCVQEFFRVSVDGIVGPETWSILLGF